MQDTIYVAADPANNNEPTLFCNTDNPAGPGNLALIPGVETMQLLYAEDTDGDTVANRYVPANKLDGDRRRTRHPGFVRRSHAPGHGQRSFRQDASVTSETTTTP